MLNKRIKVSIRGIVIALIVGASVLAGSIFMHQRHTINDLKKEVQIQTETTEQRLNYTETKIDTSTIENKFNELQKIEITSSKINIKHTYNYQREGFLGMDCKYKLTGTADFYYSHVVDLTSYEIISVSKDKITISIDRAYLNKDACHRINNTFYRMDSECDSNLLANKKDAEKATRHWEDTFDKKGIKEVENYYRDEKMIQELNKDTKIFITDLFRTMGYNQDIEIVFNN